MSIGSGTSSTDAYVFKPSTCTSFGLIGTTVYPWRRNARTARLPNFRGSDDAPITATTLLIWKNLTRIEDAVRVERRLHALHQRDFFCRKLEAEIRRLRKSNAMLPADGALERHHAFKQPSYGALAAVPGTFIRQH